MGNRKWPDIWFAVGEAHLPSGYIVPVLLKRHKCTNVWLDSNGNKWKRLVPPSTLAPDPHKAIEQYLATQRNALEQQSDAMAGTHFTKGQNNDVSNCKR